jgi:hypothetical protein
MIERREAITQIGLISIFAISGCADFPPHREISIDAISASQTESGWTLKVSVVNDNTVGNEEANFHNVTVYAYSKHGKEVGERTIGDLTYEYDVNNGKDVTVECRVFPHVVTFDAEESPCDENTDIIIGRYDGKQNGKHVWATDYRECREGLPPESSTAEDNKN